MQNISMIMLKVISLKLSIKRDCQIEFKIQVHTIYWQKEIHFNYKDTGLK
jgi:hypothetical protein